MPWASFLRCAPWAELSRQQPAAPPAVPAFALRQVLADIAAATQVFSRGKSAYRGVEERSGGWVARFKKSNGRPGVTLKSEVDSARAWDRASLKFEP